MVIGFIWSIMMRQNRQHYAWLWREQDFFRPQMWASALLVTLNILRIGQSGHYGLGAQTKFRHNVLTDAAIVVMIVLLGAYLFTFAHILVVSAGGLQAAGYDFQKFAALRESLTHFIQ
ncbi:hypothetical protein COOONC_11054 [Cooperia oncophora]